MQGLPGRVSSAADLDGFEAAAVSSDTAPPIDSAEVRAMACQGIDVVVAPVQWNQGFG